MNYINPTQVVFLLRSEKIMNIILLKPDTPAEVKVLESDKLSLNDMYKYCDCNMIDIRETAFKLLGDSEIDMIFDVEFLLQEKATINKVASELYGYRYHNECLCGNVILSKKVLDEFGEINNGGFSEEETTYLLEILENMSKVTAKKIYKLHPPMFEVMN